MLGDAGIDGAPSLRRLRRGAARRRVAAHHPGRLGRMTFRFVPTPLDAPLSLPPARAGGLDPALEPAFVPSAARDAALARLREPGALAVTSGQQPGLFTGPLYTVHKALSTAALARVLERQWGRPVVPIFWIAGDDHDFAEASDDLVAHGGRQRSPPPRCRPGRPRPRSRRCTASRWARRSPRRSRRSGPACRPPSSGTRPWPGWPGTTVPRPRSPGHSPARWPSCSAPAGIVCFDSTPSVGEAGGRAARPRAPWSGPPRSTTTSSARRRRSATPPGPPAWCWATAPRS